MKGRLGRGSSVQEGTARGREGSGCVHVGAGGSHLGCVLRSLASMLSRGVTGSGPGRPVRDSVGEAGAEQTHGRGHCPNPGNGSGTLHECVHRQTQSALRLI